MPNNTKATRRNAKPAVASVATAKPAAAVAKPSKPDTAAINRERCKANAAIVQPVYNGPSLATHRSVPPKLADALARVREPIQRAKSPTVRDESALLLCLKHSDAERSFDPTLATSDLGTLSRLASLGFLAVSGNRVQLTETGFDYAKRVAAKA